MTFDHSAVIALMALCLWQLHGLTQSDSLQNRLCALARNGSRVHGTKIVVANAWSNCHAGLLNHAELTSQTGLLLRGAKRVHTKGMLFPIDLVFLGGDAKILKIAAAVAPEQSHRGPPRTSSTLELAAGAAGAFGLNLGDVLTFPPKPEDG